MNFYSSASIYSRFLIFCFRFFTVVKLSPKEFETVFNCSSRSFCDVNCVVLTVLIWDSLISFILLDKCLRRINFQLFSVYLNHRDLPGIAWLSIMFHLLCTRLFFRKHISSLSREVKQHVLSQNSHKLAKVYFLYERFPLRSVFTSNCLNEEEKWVLLNVQKYRLFLFSSLLVF